MSVVAALAMVAVWVAMVIFWVRVLPPHLFGVTSDGGGHNGIKVWYYLVSCILCLNGCGNCAVSSDIIVERGKGGFSQLVQVHLVPERLKGRDRYEGGGGSLPFEPIPSSGYVISTG